MQFVEVSGLLYYPKVYYNCITRCLIPVDKVILIRYFLVNLFMEGFN